MSVNSTQGIGTLTNATKTFSVTEGYKKISLSVTSASTGTCTITGATIADLSTNSIALNAGENLNIVSGFPINDLVVVAATGCTVNIVASQN